MSDMLSIRTYETCLQMSHEIRETRREGLITQAELRAFRSEMAQRRPTRGLRQWTPYLKLVPPVLMLGLAIAGHITVADLKAYLGISPR